MYISRRFFSSAVGFELRNKVMSEYGDEWKFVNNFLSEKHTISISAIKLAAKIKEQLSLDVFPLIRTVAIKGYKYDGQMQFMMLGKGEHNYYYFDYPRKYYDKKGVHLEFGLCASDNMITIKET
jgi:hypothetical protein